jgi:hypothetical protein
MPLEKKAGPRFFLHTTLKMPEAGMLPLALKTLLKPLGAGSCQ